ncbi:lipid II flippase Amj family protein [Gorillibacterium sp. CAU 1737]|uniref:lipid II flippase Amj family protein n=1 Tax=Gorillibacterium sp. CAU 1737 TaxID=3140362 RepID=UPI0032608AB2
MNGFLLVFLLTVIIHAVETLSYALRYAGVRTAKYAVALSLTGIVLLVSRTSNLIQSPILGKMVDYAKQDASYPLLSSFRSILMAASIGTLVGLVLFPTMVVIASRFLSHLEVVGSLAKTVTSVTIEQLKKAPAHLRPPTWSMIRSLRIYGVPKRLLALNIVTTAIYTTGVLSALYASHLSPEHGMAASQSSGLINGLATIILALLIDPQMGIMTDKALAYPKERARLGKIFALMIITRVIGTLFAQVLLVPAAHWILWVMKWL